MTDLAPLPYPHKTWSADVYCIFCRQFLLSWVQTDTNRDPYQEFLVDWYCLACNTCGYETGDPYLYIRERVKA